MAHSIGREQFDTVCPRCESQEVTTAVYHFGATHMVECANCGFGKSEGCDKRMALARLRGKYIDATEE